MSEKIDPNAPVPAIVQELRKQFKECSKLDYILNRWPESIHHEINKTIFDEARSELATLRRESEMLRTLIELHGQGSMATAGRAMWHELRWHILREKETTTKEPGA